MCGSACSIGQVSCILNISNQVASFVSGKDVTVKHFSAVAALTHRLVYRSDEQGIHVVLSPADGEERNYSRRMNHLIAPQVIEFWESKVTVRLFDL